jgi:hypothetical protein
MKEETDCRPEVYKLWLLFTCISNILKKYCNNIVVISAVVFLFVKQWLNPNTGLSLRRLFNQVRVALTRFLALVSHRKSADEIFPDKLSFRLVCGDIFTCNYASWEIFLHILVSPYTSISPKIWSISWQSIAIYDNNQQANTSSTQKHFYV